jgi:hypothetical protein
MEAEGSVICYRSMRLRPARPAAERDRQFCRGRARSADMRGKIRHQHSMSLKRRTE